MLSVRVYATNMGTVAKNDFVKIEISESAKFKILFWNVENESYQVKLYVKEIPENWIAIIEPNNFILNSSVGKEYIKLPYTTENIKATPIDVIVKPTNSAKPGKYEIVITANSESPSSEISLSQGRLFKFIVEIENPIYFDNSKNNDINPNEENENTAITAANLKQEYNNPNYFYLIITTLIILVSFLIYKYS